MLRITKETDYGIILLAELASMSRSLASAPDLAARAGVPGPMAGKILKRLAQEGLLESERGAHGGYRLARPARHISVAEIITALEGPIALTECIARGPGECEQEDSCPTRSHWHRINSVIEGALAGISLEEMVVPPPPLWPALGANAQIDLSEPPRA